MASTEARTGIGSRERGRASAYSRYAVVLSRLWRSFLDVRADDQGFAAGSGQRVRIRVGYTGDSRYYN